jgi:hypothetical protein
MNNSENRHIYSQILEDLKTIRRGALETLTLEQATNDSYIFRYLETIRDSTNDNWLIQNNQRRFNPNYRFHLVYSAAKIYNYLNPLIKSETPQNNSIDTGDPNSGAGNSGQSDGARTHVLTRPSIDEEREGKRKMREKEEEEKDKAKEEKKKKTVDEQSRTQLSAEEQIKTKQPEFRQTHNELEDVGPEYTGRVVSEQSPDELENSNRIEVEQPKTKGPVANRVNPPKLRKREHIQNSTR